MSISISGTVLRCFTLKKNTHIYSFIFIVLLEVPPILRFSFLLSILYYYYLKLLNRINWNSDPKALKKLNYIIGLSPLCISIFIHPIEGITSL